MAGPGRVPRSEPPSRAGRGGPVKLPAGGSVKAPPLPSDIKWDKRSRKVWRGWWASPMAGRWLDSDADMLLLLLETVNAFYAAENGREKALLATEIRLRSANFGLDPMSRRRLGWVIEPSKPARPPVKRALKTDLDEWRGLPV